MIVFFYLFFIFFPGPTSALSFPVKCGKKALLSKMLFIFLAYFHCTWKIPFLLTLFSLSLCFFLSCAAGDFRHGCAGAGDEVYRSPDPGETDLPFPTEQQPALRPEQPPHQHVPLRSQRPEGTDVRGVIHSQYS